MNTIEFKRDVLEKYQIDKFFFEHLTIGEAVEIIIGKILGNLGLYDQNIAPDENYLPKKANFGTNLNNFIKYKKNTYIYGYLQDYYDRFILEYNLKRNFTDIDWNNSKLFYHGTNWRSAFSILNRIIPSSRYTDFGNNTFYVSDSFKSAVKWAVERNNQGALIIFKPKSTWINDIDPSKIKIFSHRNIDDDWKKFVYRCRNEEEPYEFENYDYISGPILANPGSSLYEYKYITGHEIPYQIAVKTNQLFERLNLSIAGIVFFPQNITQEEMFSDFKLFQNDQYNKLEMCLQYLDLSLF